MGDARNLYRDPEIIVTNLANPDLFPLNTAYEFTNKLKDTQNPSRIGAIGLTQVLIAPKGGSPPVFPLNFEDLTLTIADDFRIKAQLVIEEFTYGPDAGVTKTYDYELRYDTTTLGEQFAEVAGVIPDDATLKLVMDNVLVDWITNALPAIDAHTLVSPALESPHYKFSLTPVGTDKMLLNQYWVDPPPVVDGYNSTYYAATGYAKLGVDSLSAYQFTDDAYSQSLKDQNANYLLGVGALTRLLHFSYADTTGSFITVHKGPLLLGHTTVFDELAYVNVIPFPLAFSFDNLHFFYPLRPNDFSGNTPTAGGMSVELPIYDPSDDFTTHFRSDYISDLAAFYVEPFAMPSSPGTSDYVLQIVCNEVSTSLLAGGGGGRILKVIAVDPLGGPQSIVITPVCFEWKSVDSKEISTLSFFLANGSGDPHPFFTPEGGNMNAVLGLKIHYIV